MAKSMTPSAITDGQIKKTLDVFRSVLRKHRTELHSRGVQEGLKSSQLPLELFRLFRGYVEERSDFIIRRVKVNRSRSLIATLKATYHDCGSLYPIKHLLAFMPRGEGREVEVVFFRPVDHCTSYADVEREYELRGLRPVDLYSLAAVHEADYTFSEKYPSYTQWKDAHGNYYWLRFTWCNGKYVMGQCDRTRLDWHTNTWLAGVRI